jgi:hypothetical protein
VRPVDAQRCQCSGRVAAGLGLGMPREAVTEGCAPLCPTCSSTPVGSTCGRSPSRPEPSLSSSTWRTTRRGWKHCSTCRSGCERRGRGAARARDGGRPHRRHPAFVGAGGRAPR